MSSRGHVLAIGGAENRSREGLILRRFVRLCGGRRARIAVIPTASQLEETGAEYESVFQAIGARSSRVLPFTERADCESEEALEVLGEADGVFLTGGNQLRLSTIVGGTSVSRLLRHRHRREGLQIAGTSAGAAILSEHMIAFGQEGQTPRAGMVTLAPGLGFLRTIVVDQHFSQRNRLGRLLTALAFNPGKIGLGVDENTAALLLPDGTMEIIGQGTVTVVDGSSAALSSADEVEPGDLIQLHGMRLDLLTHGARYDLESRQALGPAAPEEAGRRLGTGS